VQAHKVVAPRREALHDRHLVPVRGLAPRLAAAERPHKRERARPHHDEVQDHRHEHAEHGAQVLHDVVALVREHDDDRVEQAEERERAEAREELGLEEGARGEAPDCVPGRHARDEGDAEVLRGSWSARDPRRPTAGRTMSTESATSLYETCI
jgi:hypothetical protein